MVTKTIGGVAVFFEANENQKGKLRTLTALFYQKTARWSFKKGVPSEPYPEGYQTSYADRSFQLVGNRDAIYLLNASISYDNNQDEDGNNDVWVWWEKGLQSDGTTCDDDDDGGGPKPTERGTLVSVQSQS